MIKARRYAVLLLLCLTTGITGGYPLLSWAQKKETTSLLQQAAVLGWTAHEADYPLCKGYFADIFPHPLSFSSATEPSDNLLAQPFTLTADQSTLAYDGTSYLSGHITLQQPTRTLLAQMATLHSQKGHFQNASLKGPVVMHQKDAVAISHDAQLNFDTSTYTLTDTLYRFLTAAGLTAWGHSDTLMQSPADQTTLDKVTYSTCSPLTWTWHLKAKQLILHKATNRGDAYGTVIYFKNTPLFYLPYLNFPLNNARKTGFLYPKFMFDEASGVGLGLPFYWNIAPNQDDTLTPSVYTERGLLLNNVYRYLTPFNRGRLEISVLPHDEAFQHFQRTAPLHVPADTPGVENLQNATALRRFLTFKDTSTLTPYFTSHINYSYVSDDYYPQDMGGIPQIAQNQLLQQASGLFSFENFDLGLNAEAYQTLHPINQAFVKNQYRRLPQLTFVTHTPFKANRFNLQANGEWVNFTITPSPGVNTPLPSGQRFNLSPTLSFPLMNSAGFFTPQIRYLLTQYALRQQNTDQAITRALPLFSIDSGLYFERPAFLFNHAYYQTLRPRLFYLYVPFRDQSEIPVFDTALQPFSVNQLFWDNRFSGIDRISNTHQLTAALQTQFTDPETGENFFSLDTGIIRYFKDRKISLCQTADCLNTLTPLVNTLSPHSLYSPWVSALRYAFNPRWHTDLDLAWDVEAQQMQNTMLTLQYTPASDKIVNVGYRFLRYGDFFRLPVSIIKPTFLPNQNINLGESSLSAAWPLNEKWQLLGSFRYSLNQKHPLTYFGGVGYNSCCFALQAVVARSFSGFDAFANPQYTTGVYLQAVFKGLSKLTANDLTGLLEKNIPGYHASFSDI